MMSDKPTIRAACEADAPEIHAMICELAEFEQLSHQVVSTPDSIRDSLFGESANVEAIVAEIDQQPVGFALFFHNYSTFLGRSGLYLEDVYVRPEYRKQGIGKALLRELAGIAAKRGCGRFEWAVLDWNDNAIEFYEGLGATVLPDWRIVRLDHEGIQRLSVDSDLG